MSPVRVRAGVNHVSLLVDDVDRAVAFYREVLGYEEPIKRFRGGHFGGEQASLRAPGSSSHHDLAITGIGDRFADARTSAGATLSHFALEVETLEELAEVRRFLIDCDSLDSEYDTGATKSVFGRDPAGNRFEVMWSVPVSGWDDAHENAVARPLDIEAALEEWGARPGARNTPNILVKGRPMTVDELIAEQKRALDMWYEGFGRGDIEYAYTGFADDCTWWGIGANMERVLYKGKQAIIEYQRAWVHNVWTGKIIYHPQHCVCDGNVLFAEWKDEAVAKATGEKYTNNGVFVFEYDGGPLVKRARRWVDSGPLSGANIEAFAKQGVGAGS